MKKTNLLVTLLLGALSSGAFALDLNNPLPNWVDSAREKADGRPPVMAPTRRGVTPSDFRIPAEYEPVGAVVMGWAGYTSMLNGIAKAASDSGAQVWAFSGPSSISGVSNYTRIPAPIDTVWVRDYGPFGLSAGSGRPGIVDSVYRHYQYRRNDDAAPAALGRSKGIGVYGMPIILDGGNLMVDSKGTLYHTLRTYIWNSDKSREEVDAHLKNYLKVKNIVTFEYSGYPGEPADGTGHIDMFMKLLNDHTVLIAVAETEPYKSNSEKAIAYFKGRKAADGEPYKIITVKGWDDGAWYTYTNSLIVNKTVIVPSYSGRTQEEAAAKAAYEQAGLKVVPVNSDYSITAGGSIHCVTQTIPVLPGRALSPEETLPSVVQMDVPASAVPLRSAGNGSALDQLIEGR